MTELRDARLQRALASAPDAHMLPDVRLREAIARQARAAVAVPAPWWRRLWPASPRQRMPWSAALASVLLVGLVTLLWRHDDYSTEVAQQVATASGTEAARDAPGAAAPAAPAPVARVPEAVAPAAARPPALADAPAAASKRAEHPAPVVVARATPPAPEAPQIPPVPQSPAAPRVSASPQAPAIPAVPAAAEPPESPAAPAVAMAPQKPAQAAAPAPAAVAAAPAARALASKAAPAAAGASAYESNRADRAAASTESRARDASRTMRVELEGQPVLDGLVRSAIASRSVPDAAWGAAPAGPAQRLEVLRNGQPLGMMELRGPLLRWSPRSPPGNAVVLEPDAALMQGLREVLAQQPGR